MKIVAQSLIAPRMPYVHLAYTAATSFTPQKSTSISGIIFIVLGVLMCFRLVVKKAKTWNARSMDLKIAPLKWCIIGVLFFYVGICFFFISKKNGVEKYLHPHSVTTSNMRSIARGYYFLCFDSKKNKTSLKFQEYINDIKKDNKNYMNKRFLDAWGNNISINIIKDGPSFVIRMDSAGPDSHWGNYDDIIREYSPKQATQGMETRIITSPVVITN